MSCTTCKQITDLYLGELSETKSIKLGSYSELLASGCQVHTTLINARYKGERGREKAEDEEMRKHLSSQITAVRVKMTLHIEEAFGETRYGVCVGPLTRIADSLTTGRDGSGRLLDPDWTSVELMKDWIRTCDHNHAGACNSRATGFSSPEVRPRLLIDTKRKCLVEVSGLVDYVCLSYVWGGAKSFMTFKDNLDVLRMPGSLMEGSRWDQLTKTVQNAILLTETLESRYLWVDCLCIVQDDADLRDSELANMANIFANASLVIVAAQGKDANYGLRGLKGISEPRQLKQQIYSIDVTGDVYGTRAWTFQEHALSHRRLFFDQDAVRWECCKTAWFEKINHGDGSEDTTKDRRGEEVAQIQSTFQEKNASIRNLASLVGAYNERDLSYQQDVGKAFAGISSILRHSFGDGFVSGLPIRFFDYALLWQPKSVISKRWKLNDEGRGRAQTPDLPTWSWFGWQCEIEHESWPGNSEGHHVFSPRWNGSLSVRYNVTDSSPGSRWSLRRTYDSSIASFNELADEAANDNLRHLQYKQLSCRTRRCKESFCVGRRLENSFNKYTRMYRKFPMVHEVVDADGELAGIINLNFLYCDNDSVLQDDWPPFVKDCKPLKRVIGKALDLVGISSMDISVQTTEQEANLDQSESVEEWYKLMSQMANENHGSFRVQNVWWVEWADSQIAWRLTLGWILQSKWDQSDLTENDFTIG